MATNNRMKRKIRIDLLPVLLLFYLGGGGGVEHSFIICPCFVSAWVTTTAASTFPSARTITTAITTTSKRIKHGSSNNHNSHNNENNNRLLALFPLDGRRRHKQTISSLTKLYDSTITGSTISNNDNNNDDDDNGIVLVLPDGYKEYGNKIIYDAAIQCGCTTKDQITITWKDDKIIVCVKGTDVGISSSSSEEEDDDDGTTLLLLDENDEEDDIDDLELEYEDSDMLEGTEDYDDIDDDVDDDDVGVFEEVMNNNGNIDITSMAKAINEALDDVDGVGAAIAANFEIEVTTQGSSDELIGSRMFEAYKGFDVIVQHMDPKKKKKKKKQKSGSDDDDDDNDSDEQPPPMLVVKVTTEGKLSERNEEYTIINIKGRMKRINNEYIESVKLPKAKKEKGVR